MTAFDTPYLLESLKKLHGFWVAGLVCGVPKLPSGCVPCTFLASCLAFSVVCTRFVFIVVGGERFLGLVLRHIDVDLEGFDTTLYQIHSMLRSKDYCGKDLNFQMFA